MLPKVQRLHITRLEGPVSPYRNSEFIPLFYLFPKEMLEEAGEIFLEVPRNPNFVFFDRKWIEFVESDMFLQFIIDATAYIVWPFMGLGAAREIYSGYEPSWKFAHAPHYWLEGLIEEGVILSVNELYRYCKKEVNVQFKFFEFEDIEVYLNHTVKSVMAKYEMYEILDVAKEFRCHEDFDTATATKKLILHGNGTTPALSIQLYPLIQKWTSMQNITMGRSWSLKIQNKTQRNKLYRR